MAIELKNLGHLSQEEQILILEGLTKDLIPIEVNKKQFLIPEDVNELIDDLFKELQNLKNVIRESGIAEEKN
tara:strand:- start:493 stop:708 length:216 start_codon:yes stop_codon:yes gene_type:complete